MEPAFTSINSCDVGRGREGVREEINERDVKKLCSSYRWGSGAQKDSSSCCLPTDCVYLRLTNCSLTSLGGKKPWMGGAEEDGILATAGFKFISSRMNWCEAVRKTTLLTPWIRILGIVEFHLAVPHCYTHMWQIDQGPASYRASLLPWIGAFRVFRSSLLDHEPTEQQPGLSYVISIQCPSQCQCFINVCGLKLAWDRDFAWRQLVNDTGTQTGRHGHIPWEAFSRCFPVKPCGPVLTLLHTLLPFLEMKSILGNSLLSYRLKVYLKVKWRIHMLKKE